MTEIIHMEVLNWVESLINLSQIFTKTAANCIKILAKSFKESIVHAFYDLFGIVSGLSGSTKSLIVSLLGK